MIIQIKGTSGSGKTTLVSNFMRQFDDVEPVYVEGRRLPVAYKMNHYSILVLGHYESTTGGCDNIKSLDDIFEKYIPFWDDEGYHIIFEGLMITNDRNRIEKLAKERSVQVICLNTPLELCKQSILERRNRKAQEKGKPLQKLEDIDFSNTEAKYRSFLLTIKELKKRGLTVLELNRQEAAGYLIANLAN